MAKFRVSTSSENRPPISERVKYPCATGLPNGDSRAMRSRSTWIHWWSPVALANLSIASKVISRQRVRPSSLPTSALSPATPSMIVSATVRREITLAREHVKVTGTRCSVDLPILLRRDLLRRGEEEHRVGCVQTTGFLRDERIDEVTRCSVESQNSAVGSAVDIEVPVRSEFQGGGVSDLPAAGGHEDGKQLSGRAVVL